MTTPELIAAGFVINAENPKKAKHIKFNASRNFCDDCDRWVRQASPKQDGTQLCDKCAVKRWKVAS